MPSKQVKDTRKSKSSKKPLCLVTGATGFLGTNLVHELVEQGWQVRAAGLSPDEAKHIRDLPIELVYGDITHAQQADQMVEGMEVVFHVAADTSFWKRNFERQRKINVDGAIYVAEACERHGVKTMVHTSTLDVLGYNPTGGSYDETSGHYNFHSMGYNYGDTKHEAEVRLRGLNKIYKTNICFVYPGFMVGPFDHTLQIGRVFFELKDGKLPGFPPGGGSFCHVREVAKAHIAAAEKGQSGEGYLCAGIAETNLSYAEFFTKMARAINAKAPKFTIPKPAFVAYGYAMEWLSSITGKAPDMNPGMARYLSSPQYALSYKAIKELGYEVPSVESCIEDALRWYRDEGYKI